jgi:hypothetical protein
MSENIPESIPTSADPRSKRPAKRARIANDAISQQASSITALFSHPDVNPTPEARAAYVRPPPEIMNNVQGSSAGAGSGEFHVYKASRRREYERLRAMDEEVKGEEDAERWERERQERVRRDEEATRKKREKRMRGKKGKGGVDKEKEKKVGGIQARVQSFDGGENNGSEESNGPREEAELGLVIHDDD